MSVAPRRIGIAVATYNSEAVIERCLAALGDRPFVVVLLDDHSTDETIARAQRQRADLIVLEGDGTNWWAGATAKAVAVALEHGVEYVVMLNPDVELDGDAIVELTDYAAARPMTIVAPLVVDRERPDEVAWAGSRFDRLPYLPIYTNRYVHKRGTPVAQVGDDPYPVDEVHGRGTVLSKAIIERIGMFDVDVFPHYGADNDYSWRALAAGIDIHVMPSIHAKLAVDNSGMRPGVPRDLRGRARGIYRYLIDRKNGEALRVWWELTGRHVPRHARLSSFLFNVGVNVARRLR